MGVEQLFPSAQECDRLRHRDRRMLQAGELTDEEAALIAKAEVQPRKRMLMTS